MAKTVPFTAETRENLSKFFRTVGNDKTLLAEFQAIKTKDEANTLIQKTRLPIHYEDLMHAMTEMRDRLPKGSTKEQPHVSPDLLRGPIGGGIGVIVGGVVGALTTGGAGVLGGAAAGGHVGDKLEEFFKKMF